MSLTAAVRSRARLAALAAALALAPAPLSAQVAYVPGGSAHDLAPPPENAGRAGLSRAIITARREGRMRAVRGFRQGDVIRRLGRPVGRLSIAVETGRGSGVAFCTASLIGEGLILTNNHCLVDNPEGRVLEAVLWMGYLRPRSAEGVERFAVAVEPIEAGAALDYAIHRVEGAPEARWGTVALDPGAALGDRQSLLVMHHPGGREQHASLACETADPAIDGDTVLHLCDTLPGSSGAPVFDNESRRMVALHYSAVVKGEVNGAKRLSDIAAVSPILSRLAAPAEPAAPSPAAALWPIISESRDRAVLERFMARFEGTPEAAAAAARLAALPLPQAAIPPARREPVRQPEPEQEAPVAERAAEKEPEAVRRLRAAAEAGDADAMYALGDRYFAGDGVPRDQTRAIGWYRRAAAARE